jgi:hypothetical protein
MTTLKPKVHTHVTEVVTVEMYEDEVEVLMHIIGTVEDIDNEALRGLCGHLQGLYGRLLDAVDKSQKKQLETAQPKAAPSA